MEGEGEEEEEKGKGGGGEERVDLYTVFNDAHCKIRREKKRRGKRGRRPLHSTQCQYFLTSDALSTFSSSLPFSSGALRFCGLQTSNTQTMYTHVHMVAAR